MNELLESTMFRPPINRAMRALDRSFFQKSIPLSAAKIRDNKQISKYRTELGPDLLRLERMQTVRSVRDPEGGQAAKALLLRPEVRPDGKYKKRSFSFHVLVFPLVFFFLEKQGRKECDKWCRSVEGAKDAVQMLLHGVQGSPSWSRLPKSASYHTSSN